jgi:hypothetical protein
MSKKSKSNEAWVQEENEDDVKKQDSGKQVKKIKSNTPGKSPAEEYEHGKKLIPRLRFWNTLAFILSMLGIIIMVVEMEVSRIMYKNEPNMINIILKAINSVTTLIVIFCLIKYWNVKIEIFKVKHLVHAEATVWSIPAFKQTLLLEILVVLLHVPPYVDQVVGWLYPNLHSNSLGLLMFLRLYMLPRMVKQDFKTHYVSHKVRLIGAINKVPFSNLFVIKASLLLHPYMMLLGSLLTYVLVWAFMYEIVETQIPICGTPDADPDKCHPAGVYYWRWVVFSFALILGIEPRTVPLTISGQSLTVVGALVGTVLLATLIAVVAQTLTLSNTESRVVDQIRTRALTEAVKDKAVRFIQSYWRFIIQIKKEARAKGKDLSNVKRLSTVVDGDVDGDGIVDKRERRAREGLIYALHQWRVMKRKGKEESQLTTLSKDVSTVLDDVSHLKTWSSSTHDRVTELKDTTLVEIQAMSKKLDAILNKVG